MCRFILGNFIFRSSLESTIELLSFHTDILIFFFFFITESMFRITLKYL